MHFLTPSRTELKLDDIKYYAKNWFQGYYHDVTPSTNPYYFDDINEKFCEYFRDQKGINIEKGS